MDRLGQNCANSNPLTPLGFIERTATIYGDRPAVVYNNTVYTWSETYRRCIRLASAISFHLRMSSGDVVSVLAPNTPAMYEMHFAVPMSGAILNTINIRLDARTVSVLLRHSDARLLFVDPQSLPLARSALALLPSDHRSPLLIPIDDPYEDPTAAAAAATDGLTYEKLVELGDPDFRWIRPKSEWDPMILNYTSGTTSAPKGVVHCHRGAFLVTVDSLVDWFVPQHPVYLWTLPMFHSNGWSFPWGIAAVAGTNVCLRRFDGPTIFAAIADNRVTHLCGAPVVLNMLANSPPSERRPLPGPVQILTAGAPPPAAVLARAESLGFCVSHGYGLTETGGIAVSCAWKANNWNRLPAAERARLKARQGVRTPTMAAVDVVDGATGKSVPYDGVTMGEVVLSGGFIMLGYLKDEEATGRAIRDGWFYTGDVGVMHPDGYLEIKDRSKDVIISGGENISSVEVESVMYGHPALIEAAVVARPDEYWGETPCAFVGLKQGMTGPPPTEAEVIAWCRDSMPHYMVPKTVIFLPELPKTSTGKIQKYVLRNMAKKLGPRVASAGAGVSPASKL
ncbi:putative acyl-activating enzyme 5, peroxisomal [Apostasia shenzhenica]|uniref:4-coumarate--CoA ligase n=1 Tax=Apostasia shenzhenica TaxID=1088818 RepID=A0A2H9ZYW2_9ASPA|nr:putative acyl-activating enzyme 5, peroxisomal [Apostasia shenzhenica]